MRLFCWQLHPTYFNLLRNLTFPIPIFQQILDFHLFRLVSNLYFSFVLVGEFSTFTYFIWSWCSCLSFSYWNVYISSSSLCCSRPYLVDEINEVVSVFVDLNLCDFKVLVSPVLPFSLSFHTRLFWWGWTNSSSLGKATSVPRFLNSSYFWQALRLTQSPMHLLNRLKKWISRLGLWQFPITLPEGFLVSQYWSFSW